MQYPIADLQSKICSLKSAIPRSGLARLEVLALVVIVLVLTGLVSAYLGRMRELSAQKACAHNLRRIGEAVLAFHEDKKFLPAARIAPAYATWAVEIAAHMQKESGLEGWDLAKRFADQTVAAREAVLTPYFCPARPRTTWESTAGEGADVDLWPGALGDYACASGDGDPQRPWTGPLANGALILGEVLEEKDGLIVRWQGRTSLASLIRGQSYTLLIGEKHVPLNKLGDVAAGDGSLYNGSLPASSARVGGPGHGLAPSPLAPFNTNFGSAHLGVCQFLHADGSVRAYAVSMSEDGLGKDDPGASEGSLHARAAKKCIVLPKNPKFGKWHRAVRARCPGDCSCLEEQAMKKSRMPKLVDALRGYNPRTFVADLIAGLTVGLVALPLAMAFAISSGVPPHAGIYCAVVAGFLISALGGSKTQIGGPTGAFVVIVFGIVAQHGVNGLFLCTIMAGFMLVILGLTGLGTAVKFIPRPVVIGFTNGIAVLIASTQVKDFLGLRIDNVPGEFLGRVEAIAKHFDTVSLSSTLLAMAALVVIILCMKYLKRVPGYIAALLLGTVIVAALQLPVETIGTRFGGIPAGLPTFAVPLFHPDMILPLLSPALTVALLGAIESLMSAVVADRMSGDKHNPNVELVAQGIANIAAPFFGGLPATGAIARTATNIRSGAKTPVAGMVHALTLVGVLLFAAPLAQYIPLAVLSAILMVVAYNMGEWKEIRKLLKMSWATISVWLITFALTVFADLTLAVEFGIVLAALLFIRKVAKTTTVSKVTKEYVEDGRLHILQDKHIPEHVTVLRIHGPFLFGAAEKLSVFTDHVEELTPVVILRLRNMSAIDATGLIAAGRLRGQTPRRGSHSDPLCAAGHNRPNSCVRPNLRTMSVGRTSACTSRRRWSEQGYSTRTPECRVNVTRPLSVNGRGENRAPLSHG